MREYSETVPMQYEDGFAMFRGLKILVDPRVLIPRPETELLVETVTSRMACMGESEKLVLDICTGSCAVGIALTHIMGNCRVIASDVSRDALDVAVTNISRFGLVERIRPVLSDMFDGIGEYEEGFDCIVSNPPYVSAADYEKVDAWVKAEPRLALYGGIDGMDYLNVIAQNAPVFLKIGGFVAVEVGYDQARKVKIAFERHGLEDVGSIEDFNGYERVIVGWKHG